MSEEFDADVAQDEVMAAGGLYRVPPVPGTTRNFLLIMGGVALALGVLLELMVHGIVYPIPNYFPTALGSALVVAVLVLGVVGIIAGIAVHYTDHREPRSLKPIV